MTTDLASISIADLESAGGDGILRAALPFAQDSYILKLLKRAAFAGSLRAIDVIIQYALDFPQIVYGPVGKDFMAKMIRRITAREYWIHVYCKVLIADRADICKEMRARIDAAKMTDDMRRTVIHQLEFDEALITLRKGRMESLLGLCAMSPRYWKVDYSGHIEDRIMMILANVSRGGNREIIAEVRESLSRVKHYISRRDIPIICAGGAAHGGHIALSEEFLAEVEHLAQPEASRSDYDAMKCAMREFLRSNTIITKRIFDIVTNYDKFYNPMDFAARFAKNPEQIRAAFAIAPPIGVNELFPKAAYHGNVKFCEFMKACFRDHSMVCYVSGDCGFRYADEMYHNGWDNEDAATCELAIKYGAKNIYITDIANKRMIGLQTYIHAKIIDTRDRDIIMSYRARIMASVRERPSAGPQFRAITDCWIRDCNAALN